MVWRPPRERQAGWFNSRFGRGSFPRWRQTSDLKIGTPVAILPGARHRRVSAGTGLPGVSTLWLGRTVSFMFSFYHSVAIRRIVRADQSLRYTSMLLGRKASKYHHRRRRHQQPNETGISPASPRARGKEQLFIVPPRLFPFTAGCSPLSMPPIVLCWLPSCSRWFNPSLLCRLALFYMVVLLISSLSLVANLCSVWSTYCPPFLLYVQSCYTPYSYNYQPADILCQLKKEVKKSKEKVGGRGRGS